MLRKLSSNHIYEIGYGAMPLSLSGRPNLIDINRLFRTLEDSPIQLIDTALAYGLDEQDIGHNEKLLANFLKNSSRKNWIIATKAGTWRDGQKWVINGHPKFIRQSCENSLRNLRIDAIDLYQLHAFDPQIPAAETIGEFRRLKDEGKIKMIGLSNVKLEDLLSVETSDIASIQNELSVLEDYDLQSGVIPYCEANNITYLAHSPVGGHDNYKKIHSHEKLIRYAKKWGVSTYELMLLWLLEVSPIVIPIPGARRIESLISSSSVNKLNISSKTISGFYELIKTNNL